MVMPAFDMEPSSPSPAPDGTASPTSGDDVLTAAGSEASTKLRQKDGKPRPASLTSIGLRSKAPALAKTGDLTRLFELAHQQASVPASTPPSELAPSVASPPSPESEPAPVAAAEPVSETETAPAIEAPPVTESEPATVAMAEPAPGTEPAPVIEASPVTESKVAPVEPPVLETPAAPDFIAESEPAPAPSVDPIAVPEVPFETAEPPVETKAALLPAPPVADAEPDAPPASTTEPPMARETAPVPPPVEAAPPMTAPIVESAPANDPPAESAIERSVASAEVSETTTPAMAVTAVVPVPEPPPAAPVEAPPAPAPVAAAPAPAAAPEPSVRKFAELADYWRSLRVGDDHPASESVDRDLVTERWPGSLLISYTPASQDPRGELRPGRVIRLGSACAETQNVVDAGSHSTEWMLEVARTALINDEPIEEQQRLATLTGVAGFRMIALPLGPPRGLANAVLCALLPSPNAPRFGKRRTWL